MEAMLGISLYRYPYLTTKKCFISLIIAFVFSPTKLWVRWVLFNGHGFTGFLR
jgi:hypothetical protein